MASNVTENGVFDPTNGSVRWGPFIGPTNALLAYSFEFLTQSRGNVLVTPDHDTETLAFRAMNLSGFELVQASWPARQVGQALLDELAKRIVQQPNGFA